MPAKPNAPSPSSRQTCRSGWAILAASAQPGPGAEAAVRARVHPAARLVGLDHAAGEGDEVAAVADHDRVAVEHLGELAVDAHRVERRAVVGQVVLLGRALLVLDRAQRARPRPARSVAAAARGAARRACRRRCRRARPPPRAGARARARTSRSRRSSSRRRTSRRSRAGSPSARRPRAPRRRPSARRRARARRTSGGRPARSRAPGRSGTPGTWSSSQSARSAFSPCAQ